MGGQPSWDRPVRLSFKLQEILKSDMEVVKLDTQTISEGDTHGRHF